MMFMWSSSTPCRAEKWSVIRHARTPGTLLAQTVAPTPVPQTATPRSAEFVDDPGNFVSRNSWFPARGRLSQTSACFLRGRPACDRPFMAGWIAPASHRCHSFNLTWSPGIGLILVNRRARFEHRIDDAPGFLHVVLSRERRGISFHRRSQYALVRVHVGRPRRPAGYHLDRLAGHALARTQYHHSHGDGDLGTEAEPQMVFRQGTFGNQCRRLAKLADNFRGSHGQAFSGTDVERNPFPAPGIDLQPKRSKGLRFRVLCYARFIAVAEELPAYEILLFDW